MDDNGRGRGLRDILVWAVLLAVPLMFVIFLLPQSLPIGDAQIPISQVAADVQRGSVRSLTLQGDTVLVQFDDGTTAQSQNEPNTSLLDTLHAEGVTPAELAGVTIQVASQPFWASLGLLVWVIPAVLILGAIVLMSRQGPAQGSGDQTLSFLKSRARKIVADRPKVRFDDAAGVDEAKQELREVVDFLKSPSRFTAVGARIPKGVLLIGPPGTGKTLLARAVAGEAGVPFFSISGSEFVELFVGVGASRVRDLFDQAKRNAPCIVFVDEIDAVGRQRGAGLGGGNDEREQTLNQLLVAMDGFDERVEIVVLAATNRPDVLDPALLRPGRFDRQVTVGLPDRAGRAQILAVHVRGKPLAQDVDLERLSRSTPGFSGADLANLVNEAALSAARDGRGEIEMADFERALDKIILGVERPHLHSEEERRVVAYHEAGHALVAACTPGADPVQKVTIIPRGRALGVTEQVPTDDRLNYPRSYLLGRLAVLLGGRAAEEVVFAEPTTGAENDLDQATKLARRMVGSWGMVESVGPVHFDDGSSNVFLGRDIIQSRPYAEQTAARLDEAVAQLIEQARSQATSVITSHREALDQIVAQLLEHETISGDEVRHIVGVTTPLPRSPVRAAT